MKKITIYLLAAMFAATLNSCEKSRPENEDGTPDPVSGATKKRTTNILGHPIDPSCRMTAYIRPDEDIAFIYDKYDNLSILRDTKDGETSALKFFYDNYGNLVKIEDSSSFTYTFVYAQGSNRASNIYYHDLSNSEDDLTMFVSYRTATSVITSIADENTATQDVVTVDFNSNYDPVRLERRVSDINTEEIYTSYVVAGTFATSPSINPLYGSSMADFFIESMFEVGTLDPESGHYLHETLNYLDLQDPLLTATSTLTNLETNNNNYATSYHYLTTGNAWYVTSAGFDDNIQYSCP